jgi:hypothetical protein
LHRRRLANPKPRTTSLHPDLDGYEVTLTKSTPSDPCMKPKSDPHQKARGAASLSEDDEGHRATPPGTMDDHPPWSLGSWSGCAPHQKQSSMWRRLFHHLDLRKAAPSAARCRRHADLGRSASPPRRTPPCGDLLAPGKGRPAAAGTARAFPIGGREGKKKEDGCRDIGFGPWSRGGDQGAGAFLLSSRHFYT